ncbi:MAG TPA: amidohydrolase family protein [Acidimicrobiales bacterium]|nr:amidohydrolase family protein [Acidimicrobiales bacterium]
MSVDYSVFDADNHYYEAPDAFIRHIDPKMAKRAMQWADINGKRRLLVGGAINHFIPNPLFDPVARPGSLDEYMRGHNSEAKDVRAAFGALEPINPAYRDRDARLAVMDDQGISAAFLFPTLGVGMEESLHRDPPALVSAFSAFNRWVHDDWGFNYKDRILAAPMISLVDEAAAINELEYALTYDARVVCIKGGPVRAGDDSWSPGDRRYDQFWARINESGVTVGIHSGDSGYQSHVDAWEPTGDFEAFRRTPFTTVLVADRAPYETFAALICHGVFDRFPNVRVASIESGSEWVPTLIKKLRKAYGQDPKGFGRDPVDALREHVWVAPYYEDDLASLKHAIGVDHILFGSDWPHAEGLADPKSFAADLRRFAYDEDEIRTIMVDNGAALATRRASTH